MDREYRERPFKRTNLYGRELISVGICFKLLLPRRNQPGEVCGRSILVRVGNSDLGSLMELSVSQLFSGYAWPAGNTITLSNDAVNFFNLCMSVCVLEEEPSCSFILMESISWR